MCGGNDDDDTKTDSGYSSRFGSPVSYDPSFKGPVKSRSCTDVICCILFVLCIIGMVAVCFLGFVHGDPRRLVYPTDTRGNICGYGEYSDRPKLIFFDLLACSKMGHDVAKFGCPTPQMCVKECPKTNYVYLESVIKERNKKNQKIESERNKLICKYGVDKMSESITDLVKTGKCAAYYMKSISVAHRCIPAVFNSRNFHNHLLSGNSTVALENADGLKITPHSLDEATRYLSEFYKFHEYGEMIYSDVKSSWLLILVCFLIAVGISLFWVILLRWLAAVLIWVTLITFLGLLGFITYYTFSMYVDLKSTNVTAEFGLAPAFVGNFEYYIGLKQTWLIAGIVSAILLGVSILLLIIVAKRLCVAIELIKEASRAVGAMMFTFIWPFIPFLLQLGTFFFWLTSAIYLASMGTPQAYSTVVSVSKDGTNILSRIPCNESTSESMEKFCDFVRYGGDNYTTYLELFVLFMTFWIINFVTSLNQMVLSGAFASYYWAFNKPNDVPRFPIIYSFGRALRYHLGSLAFGSLIIAVVQLVRVILDYIDYKLRDSNNKVAKFMLKCMKCCLWCLENFLKFLNKNAYIMIAIHGKNFCTSAKKAFSMIMRNALRTVIVDKVTDLIMFLSKLMVTAAVGITAFYWAQGKIPFIPGTEIPRFNYYLAPVAIIIIGSYFIASCFFSVYEMAVDTIFLCFVEDTERNDGSNDRPYYMNKELMKILGKKNNKLLDGNNTD